jgi:hypothetical protein
LWIVAELRRVGALSARTSVPALECAMLYSAILTQPNPPRALAAGLQGGKRRSDRRVSTTLSSDSWTISSGVGDVARHAGVGDAGLPRLEANNPARLSIRQVSRIAVCTGLQRTSSSGPPRRARSKATIGVPVASVRPFDRLDPDPCPHQNPF